MQASGKVYVLSFVPLRFIDYKADWPSRLVVSWGREEMIYLKYGVSYKFLCIIYQILMYVQYIELLCEGMGRPVPAAKNASYGSFER